ncbi:MAG TPA: flagellar assembly protein FliH [Ornithinibacillus sp.]|nr:flagellar assembly protein FliH [Ornithinibacillus sp.]
MVEETISLFSSEPQSKRIIQLKPIQRPIQDNADDTLLQSKLAQLEGAKEELELVQQQQLKVLEETEKQIEEQLENWEQEKLALIEQANEAGYQAGFEQGKAESLFQFKQLIEQANSIILATKKDYEATLEKSEESMLMLAIKVAEKIMKQKLSEEPESFLPIVKDAIQAIKDQRVLSIYLSPSNYEYVLAQKSELERVLDSSAELSILVNESLQDGSCVIEHPFGRIDASIDTQLSQVKQVLYELVMEQGE